MRFKTIKGMYISDDVDYYDDSHTAKDIILGDKEPRDTGLLDQWGDPILFYPERLKIGY